MGLKPLSESPISTWIRFSLNRTSVGLKLALSEGWGDLPCPPQSNQRGIETRLAVDGAIPNARGLNRTSVGLKRGGWRWSRSQNRSQPQSNQRGIETLVLKVPELPHDLASIEPAWD